MKKLTKLGIVSLVLMLMMSLSFSGFFTANADSEALDEVTVENHVSIQGVEGFGLQGVPEAPILEVQRGEYHCAVRFTWHPGSGGDQLKLTARSGAVYTKTGSYSSVIMGDYLYNDGVVSSEFNSGRTYNSTSGSRS